MANELNSEEPLVEETSQESSLSGQPVALTDLPPELAHKKLMAEQQGPPPVPTMVGQPPLPEGINAVEQFLLGQSPYDPIRFIKEKLTTPTSTELPVFGKTIDTAIQGLVDLLMPSSTTEALGQFALGAGTGKLMAPIASRVSHAIKATRPIAREIADEALGKALATPESIAANTFYKAADESGKLVPVKITEKIGKLSGEYTQEMTFAQAQTAMRELRATEKRLRRADKIAEADKAKDAAKMYEDSIETAFPGFKATQAGYKRMKDIGRIQELVGRKDPVSSLELDIRKGRSVLGPDGLIGQEGGRVAKFLSKSEREEVLKILEDLGPEPGSHILRQMIEGRIVGGAIGGTLGFQHAGATGAAVGGLTGIIAPQTFNWMISQALRHPATRAFFKRSMEQKGGLANVNFWRTLGAIGERLGMNMFAPPPEEVIEPTGVQP